MTYKTQIWEFFKDCYTPLSQECLLILKTCKIMRKTPISDVMIRNPIVSHPSISLLDASRLMIKNRVGSILLKRDKKLVGILSSKDILWAIVKKPKIDLSKIRAIEVSPKKMATIRPEATIEETINKMKKYKFDKLPVIKEGELLGLITLKDLMHFNPDIYPELVEFEKIKEEERLKRKKELKERKYQLEGTSKESESYDPWKSQEE